MKYYILANGQGTRWNNYRGVPKQLIEIDGETLLHRAIRLLREEGVAREDIFICGKQTDPDAMTVLTKSPTKREVFEEVANLAQEPFVILYGDCYYTKACIHEVVTRPIKKYDEFFTIHPNPNTGCKWAEGYAHRCNDWEWWRDEMHAINTNAELIRTGKDWFIHWWLLGVRDERINSHPVECYDPDHDIYWCDETDDFDYPEDLETFCKVTGHKCTSDLPDHLTVVIPHYNTPELLKRQLDALAEQKIAYPETQILVIDDGSDCDMSWVNQYDVKLITKSNGGVSSARNLGLQHATGRYIAFCDADDLVKPDYLATNYKNMRDGYDYVLYPFENLGTGEIDCIKNELIGNWAVWAWCFNRRIIGAERFNESLAVAEDVDWLRRVIKKEQNGLRADRAIYCYDWNANPESLCKRFNRGDITVENKGNNYAINIRVRQAFNDIKDGHLITPNTLFTTTDEARATRICELNLGRIESITHGRQVDGGVIVFYDSPYIIGGIETALRAISSAFPNKNLVFIFRGFQKGAERQILAIGKRHTVLIDDDNKHYACDVALFMGHQNVNMILPRITARKYYQQLHTDYDNLTKMDKWRDFQLTIDPKINKVLSVSKRVKEGAKAKFGIDSVIVPNIMPERPNRLVFVCMSRGTAEKGLDRLLSFTQQLKAQGKDFVVFLCGGLVQADNYEQLKNEPNIVPIPASIYNESLYRAADYCIVTSYNEAYCYAAHEALSYGVPIIGYKGVEVLEELAKDGHGYIIGDTLTNEEIHKIFNEKPTFEPVKFGVAPIWHKVLGGKL